MIIDEGESEQEVIGQLRQSFPSWPPEHFNQFSKHDFEEYYPACFQDEVVRVLNLPDNSNEKKKKKQAKKTALLKKVMAWIDEEEDIEQVKEAFASSAGEVIAKLKNIESRLVENTSL